MSATDDCNKITGFPIPKAYREAYETQGWYYNTPDCTYCKNPPTRENYAPENSVQRAQRESNQALDFVINETKKLEPGKLLPIPAEEKPYIPITTDVIYFNKSPTTSTYYAYPNAYPAYPYLPCVFPNTSSESYS